MGLLVTIGTDGATDWVKTPDGLRYNLGTVSALRLVSTCAPRHIVKKTLDTFLTYKEAMVSIDETKMWELLAPRRARWSSMMPLCAPYSQETTMDSIFADLTALETHITALKEASAKKASNLSAGVAHLVKLANKIKSPNQSTNSTYYNLGEPKVHEVGDKVAGLSYDTYVANSELATAITAKAEETVGQIDKLVTAGRKFNASRAKADVMAVSQKVAGILATDLTASWVKSDLTKLASRMDEIHGLFVKAK